MHKKTINENQLNYKHSYQIKSLKLNEKVKASPFLQPESHKVNAESSKT